MIELNDVFEQKYRFNSQILTLGDKRHPQLQLDRGITNFVFDNDGPCRTNLLIVYYTGHGTHSSEKGLDIAGSVLHSSLSLETNKPQYPPSGAVSNSAQLFGYSQLEPGRTELEIG